MDITIITENDEYYNYNIMFENIITCVDLQNIQNLKYLTSILSSRHMLGMNMLPAYSNAALYHTGEFVMQYLMYWYQILHTTLKIECLKYVPYLHTIMLHCSVIEVGVKLSAINP